MSGLVTIVLGDPFDSPRWRGRWAPVFSPEEDLFLVEVWQVVSTLGEEDAARLRTFCELTGRPISVGLVEEFLAWVDAEASL